MSFPTDSNGGGGQPPDATNAATPSASILLQEEPQTPAPSFASAFPSPTTTLVGLPGTKPSHTEIATLLMTTVKRKFEWIAGQSAEEPERAELGRWSQVWVKPPQRGPLRSPASPSIGFSRLLPGLPEEIADKILPRKSVSTELALTLCKTSYALLTEYHRSLCPSNVSLTPAEALLFFLARAAFYALSALAASSGRIRIAISRYRIDHLTLTGLTNDRPLPASLFAPLVRAVTRNSGLVTLVIQHLVIAVSDDKTAFDTIGYFSPVLRLVNPRTLRIIQTRSATTVNATLVTIHQIDHSFFLPPGLTFITRWTRLGRVRSETAGSLFVFSPSTPKAKPPTTIFEEALVHSLKGLGVDKSRARMVTSLCGSCEPMEKEDESEPLEAWVARIREEKSSQKWIVVEQEVAYRPSSWDEARASEERRVARGSRLHRSASGVPRS